MGNLCNCLRRNDPDAGAKKKATPKVDGGNLSVPVPQPRPSQDTYNDVSELGLDAGEVTERSFISAADNTQAAQYKQATPTS